MKRFFILLLSVALLLTSTGYAEGKIKVTHKNLYIIDGDDTGYFYAKYENVGDEAIGVGTGTLVAFTEDDEILLTEEYINACPNYILLEPGEEIYAKTFIWDSALNDGTISDYKYSVEEYEYAKRIERIPCDVTFEINGAGTYENYLYVTFTNTTDKEQYGLYMMAALLDAEGDILFVDGSTASNIAVHPSSTLTIQISIPNDLMVYYEVHDLVPVSAEAMVCYAAE